MKNMDTNYYEVVITASAKKELENIYKYISEHLKAHSSAFKLIKKIEQMVLSLEQFPYSCPKIYVKPKNIEYRKLVINKKYIVLYKIDEELKKVNVVHIYYTKQDYLL